MKVIENEVLVAIDCDDTLVMWSEPTVPGIGKIEFDFAMKSVYLTPHTYHCDLIKMYKLRGYHVTVWSANGYAWAEQVVARLGLEDYVDVVSSKLTKYVDDSEDPGGILGARVYCKDITKDSLLPADLEVQLNPIISIPDAECASGGNFGVTISTSGTIIKKLHPISGDTKW